MIAAQMITYIPSSVLMSIPEHTRYLWAAMFEEGRVWMLNPADFKLIQHEMDLYRFGGCDLGDADIAQLLRGKEVTK